MKRQYSFNEIPQNPPIQLDYQNKPISQPYYTGNKQNKQSWTDIRVEQIKKKYQTPSHRKITSNHGLHQKNRQIHPQSQNNPFASYRNALRDSLASPNLTKKQYRPPSNPTLQLPKQDNNRILSSNKQNTDIKQNPNFLDKFTNMKNLSKYDIKSTNKYNNKYKQIQFNHNNKIDPRVENIDKINIKIKNILDCLHQNQFYHQIASNKSPQQLKSSFLQKSVNQKNLSNDRFHDTKIISRQKFIPDEHLTTPPMKLSTPINQKYIDKYSLTPQTKQNTITKYRLEDKYNNIKNSQIFQQQKNQNKQSNKQQQIKQQDSWFEENQIKITRNRSKSCLNNKKYHVISSQQQYHNNHKKLDDQIIKINTRIKQFQEEKKKLNIEFIPYHYQMKNNKSNHQLHQNTTYRYNITQQQCQQPPLTNKAQFIHTYQKKYNAIHKNYDDQSRKKYLLDAKKALHPQNHFPPTINQPQKIPQAFPIQKQPEQIHQKQGTPQFQQRPYKQDYQQLTQQPIENKCQTQLKQKTQFGIQERKKKLMNQTTTIPSTNQQKIFIQNLLTQVKLDQKLRNAKIWYRDLTDVNKQQLLHKQATKLGICIDAIQLSVTQQQDNPFYSIHDNQQSYKSLIQHWQNSQRYWQQKQNHQVQINKQILQKQTKNKIDLENKGYCTIEDFVRFLNIQTGTFYRNRDLILIFRRISKSHQIQFKQFIHNFYL